MAKLRLNFHISIALSLLLCAVSLDYLVLSARADSAAVVSSSSATIPAKTDPLSPPQGLSQRVQKSLDRIRPSLVTINGAPLGSSHPVLPPLLPELSNGDFNTFRDLTPFSSILGTDADRSGVATGVIVTEDGFVWTSHDIVRGLDSVSVTLQDHTSYDGKVVFSDAEFGFGIVKIDGQKLPAAKLGETAHLKPADWAIAVALDDCHEPNLVMGMISSFKRPKSGSNIGTIRCSFPIPTDFRGCAIVNLDGEVIGINSAMPTLRGSSFTKCYALDSDSAKGLHQKVMEMTTVSHDDAIPGIAVSAATVESDKSSRTGKEGKSRQIEISRLFAGPSSEWTSDSITSSLRNWFRSWQGADCPLPHPAWNASESR